MIIQELKPSKRVRGRWLAVLEDGSLLRVGEGEVLQFSLCAGRELTEEGGGAPPGRCPHRRAEREGPESAGWPPHVPPGAGAEAGELGGCSGGRRPSAASAGGTGLSERRLLCGSRWCAITPPKGYGLRKLRDELYRRGCPELWDEALDRAEDPAEAIDAFLAKSWETRRRRTDGRGNGCRTPWPGEAMPGATSARGLRRYGAEAGFEE